MTRKKLRELAEEWGISEDEMAHELVDMGEINSTEHAALLSKKERERVYGK